jgi:hypothetical protein
MKVLTKSRKDREISDINCVRVDYVNEHSNLEQSFEAEVPHRHNASLSYRQNK